MKLGFPITVNPHLDITSLLSLKPSQLRCQVYFYTCISLVWKIVCVWIGTTKQNHLQLILDLTSGTILLILWPSSKYWVHFFLVHRIIIWSSLNDSVLCCLYSSIVLDLIFVLFFFLVGFWNRVFLCVFGWCQSQEHHLHPHSASWALRVQVQIMTSRLILL